MENSSNNAKQTINFIAFLRGPAALLVVWDHLIANWADKNGVTWKPVTLARTYITRPLAIIQDFGFFGVVLFFLISGFIISYVIQRENRLQFFVKRLFRIFPPFIMSIVCIVLFYGVYGHITPVPTFMSERSAGDIFLSMTLLNYFFIPQNPINGVAWTLIIEIIFYALSLILLPLLQRRPKIAIAAGLGFCSLILYACRSFGDNFFLFASTVAYLPFLIMGQIIYFSWAKKISLTETALFSIATYFVLVKGLLTIHTGFYSPENSYGVSFIYAYLTFLLFMVLEKYVRTDNIFGFFSNVSYSLYLYHGDIGFLLLTILYPLTGFTFAITITTALIMGMSYLSFRLIEKPSQNYARKLLNSVSAG
ncbi:MAG: acyltransferase [Nitrospirae bacterium]|nr:acyltransferase [Nitrospirota bacterium]